jgi:type I site-specific restriction endonuclease
MDLKVPKLGFPDYNFKIKQKAADFLIFDNIRKKYVSLTPEEWVRQHMVMYLTEDKGFPSSRISVEHALKINNLIRRADIVFFGRYGQPLLVVECKAPDVKINQQVFDQVVRYNYILKVSYILVTNGRDSYCCSVDYREQKCNFLKQIPDYTLIDDG